MLEIKVDCPVNFLKRDAKAFEYGIASAVCEQLSFRDTEDTLHELSPEGANTTAQPYKSEHAYRATLVSVIIMGPNHPELTSNIKERIKDMRDSIEALIQAMARPADLEKMEWLSLCYLPMQEG